MTFANETTLGANATGIFVTANNTVYATSTALNSVLIWPEGGVNQTNSIFGYLNSPFSTFVSIGGDVYADNGENNGRVDKWGMNATNSTTVMLVSGRCGGLFVDIYESLYCSLPFSHRVLKKSVDSNANRSITVAGTGTVGSTPEMLHNPYGIFVHIDLSLYVADYSNDRVQLFRSGQSNGTTVAGTGAPGTIALQRPTSVILDGDGYIFIVDQARYRIIGSGPRGFRCIAACTGNSGAASNQLAVSLSLSFDSYGNLYVTDAFNHRIQKFMLATSACGELSLTMFQVLVVYSFFVHI